MENTRFCFSTNRRDRLRKRQRGDELQGLMHREHGEVCWRNGGASFLYINTQVITGVIPSSDPERSRRDSKIQTPKIGIDSQINSRDQSAKAGRQ